MATANAAVPPSRAAAAPAAVHVTVPKNGLVCPQGHVKWIGTRDQDDPLFQEDVVRHLERHCLVPGTREFQFTCETGVKRVPFPYQRVLNCLVRPDTPVQRALVVWMTGAGKTQGIVKTLDNYYTDPRPKVVLLPKRTLVNNFVSDFVKSPTQYGDFVRTYLHGPNFAGKDFVTSERALQQWTCRSKECTTSQGKAGTANVRAYKCHTCGQLEPSVALPKVQDLLEMKGLVHRAGTPGFPLAPVRALEYRKAGGAQAARRELTALSFAQSGKSPALIARRAAAQAKAKTGTGTSTSAGAGAGTSAGKAGRAGAFDSANPYNHCIVLCDEAHTLVAPDERDGGRYQYMRDALREWLYGATDCTLVAFTATPVPAVDTADRDYASLLRMVKGARFAHSPAHTGFIFYYNYFSPGLFPSTVPDLNTCGCLGNFVPAALQGRNLVTYIRKHHELAGGKPQAQKRLFNYCNMSTYAPQAFSKDFYQGLLSDPVGYATKLALLTHRLNQRPEEKTLVIVHRADGFKGVVKAMSVLFGQAGVQWGALYDVDETFSGTGDDPATLRHEERKKLAAEELIEKFNAFNPTAALKYAAGKGEIRVLVIDAENFSEGVSFFGVRRVVLLNPPTSYKDYLQRIGRAFRACASHITNLPDPQDRNVAVDIYVAVIRPADVEALRATDSAPAAAAAAKPASATGKRRRTTPSPSSSSSSSATQSAAPLQAGTKSTGGKATSGKAAGAKSTGAKSTGAKSTGAKAAGRAKKPRAPRAPSAGRKKSGALQGLSAPADTMDMTAADALQHSRAAYLAFIKAHFEDVALDAGLYDGMYRARGPIGVHPSELEPPKPPPASTKSPARTLAAQPASSSSSSSSPASPAPLSALQQVHPDKSRSDYDDDDDHHYARDYDKNYDYDRDDGKRRDGHGRDRHQDRRHKDSRRNRDRSRDSDRDRYGDRDGDRGRDRDGDRDRRRRSGRDRHYDDDGRDTRRRQKYDRNRNDTRSPALHKQKGSTAGATTANVTAAASAAGRSPTKRPRSLIKRVYDKVRGWWTGDPQKPKAPSPGALPGAASPGAAKKRDGLLGLGGQWYTLGLGGGQGKGQGEGQGKDKGKDKGKGQDNARTRSVHTRRIHDTQSFAPHTQTTPGMQRRSSLEQRNSRTWHDSSTRRSAGAMRSTGTRRK
jgi:hypothetical protein